MIKIDRYKLENYRNIRSADLGFHNFNVIIGTNNSGKSNFIQSFSFLNYIINGPIEEISSAFKNGFAYTLYRNLLPTNFRFTEDDNSVPYIGIAIDFMNTETNRRFSYAIRLSFRLDLKETYAIQFHIEHESLFYKDLGKPGAATRIFDRKDQKLNYGTAFPNIKALSPPPESFSLVRVIQLLGTDQEAYADAVQSLSQVLKTPAFYFSHTELAKNDNKDRLNTYNGRIVAFDLEQEIIQLENTPQWNIFQMALQHILGVTDLQIISFNLAKGTHQHEPEKVHKTIVLQHSGFYKSLNELSDGSILLIALIIKVLNSDHDIFFIEEPENSTHPKALVDLINFLQSFSENKQFIITSHSIVLLNKTKLDQIITSCQGKDGLSEIANVSDRTELKNRLRSGFVNFSDELFFADQEEEFD